MLVGENIRSLSASSVALNPTVTIPIEFKKLLATDASVLITGEDVGADVTVTGFKVGATVGAEVVADTVTAGKVGATVIIVFVGNIVGATVGGDVASIKLKI